MKLHVCVTFLLLICSLYRLDCSLPNFTPATPQLQVEVSVNAISPKRKKMTFGRLPGLCGRLKRRRITILCNLEKFCWPGRRRGRSQNSGQVCHCPRGSGCSHFFVHSL